MQETENTVIQRAPVQPKLYIRCVDDIFIERTVGKCELVKFKEKLEKKFETIKFTFLDIKIYQNSYMDAVDTKVHSKLTFIPQHYPKSRSVQISSIQDIH